MVNHYHCEQLFVNIKKYRRKFGKCDWKTIYLKFCRLFSFVKSRTCKSERDAVKASEFSGFHSSYFFVLFMVLCLWRHENSN